MKVEKDDGIETKPSIHIKKELKSESKQEIKKWIKIFDYSKIFT
jgi:hypothetical protein